MDTRREVLYTVARAPDGIGWYGIGIRLGMRGTVLEENLMHVLRTLVAEELLTYEEAPDHSHGVYRVTDAGRQYLRLRR